MNKVKIRQLLLRLRQGESTIDHWNLLLTRQLTNSPDLTEFDDATRLFFNNDEVAKYNHEQLNKLLQPVANISANHSSSLTQKN